MLDELSDNEKRLYCPQTPGKEQGNAQEELVEANSVIYNGH